MVECTSLAALNVLFFDDDRWVRGNLPFGLLVGLPPEPLSLTCSDSFWVSRDSGLLNTIGCTYATPNWYAVQAHKVEMRT